MYIVGSQVVRLNNVLKFFNKGGGVRCLGTQSALYLRKFSQQGHLPQHLLLEEGLILGQVSFGEKDLGVWLWP